MGQATRDMERWLAEYPGFLTQHPYHDAGGVSSMECEALMVHDLRNAYPMLLSKVPFFTPWADNSDPGRVLPRASRAAAASAVRRPRRGAGCSRASSTSTGWARC